jgi:hypothetical protein
LNDKGATASAGAAACCAMAGRAPIVRVMATAAKIDFMVKLLEEKTNKG